MLIFLIVGLIFILMGCIGYYLSSRHSNIPFVICIWSFLFAVIGVAIILGTIQSSENTKQPEAIDVYRGKTELIVIHYDTNNIDSVVIWKSE